MPAPATEIHNTAMAQAPKAIMNDWAQQRGHASYTPACNPPGTGHQAQHQQQSQHPQPNHQQQWTNTQIQPAQIIKQHHETLFQALSAAPLPTRSLPMAMSVTPITASQADGTTWENRTSHVTYAVVQQHSQQQYQQPHQVQQASQQYKPQQTQQQSAGNVTTYQYASAPPSYASTTNASYASSQPTTTYTGATSYAAPQGTATYGAAHNPQHDSKQQAQQYGQQQQQQQQQYTLPAPAPLQAGGSGGFHPFAQHAQGVATQQQQQVQQVQRVASGHMSHPGTGQTQHPQHRSSAPGHTSQHAHTQYQQQQQQQAATTHQAYAYQPKQPAQQAHAQGHAPRPAPAQQHGTGTSGSAAVSAPTHGHNSSHGNSSYATAGHQHHTAAGHSRGTAHVVQQHHATTAAHHAAHHHTTTTTSTVAPPTTHHPNGQVPSRPATATHAYPTQPPQRAAGAGGTQAGGTHTGPTAGRRGVISIPADRIGMNRALAGVVKRIMDHDDHKFLEFNAKVPTAMVRDYPQYVTKHEMMWLREVLARTKRDHYNSATSFLADIRQIHVNCVKYNHGHPTINGGAPGKHHNPELVTLSFEMVQYAHELLGVDLPIVGGGVGGDDDGPSKRARLH